MLIRKIGIDLGTCNSLVFIPKKGVILQEPSVVAVTLAENKILAIGEAAKEMTGRTPDTIRVYRPLKDGVIADYRVTQAMLRYFIDKVTGFWKFIKVCFKQPRRTLRNNLLQQLLDAKEKGLIAESICLNQS